MWLKAGGIDFAKPPLPKGGVAEGRGDTVQ